MENVRRILVAVADIKHSRSAVHKGVDLARTFGADLVVLHAEHDPFGQEGWNLPFLSVDEDYKTLLKDAKAELDEAIRAERAKGLKVTEIVRTGEPAGVIRKVIDEEKIDLLVMSAHEEGRLEHFLFGRIADTLVRRMPCSILLVKKAPEA